MTRLKAGFIDFIVLSPWLFTFLFYNPIVWKSYFILFLGQTLLMLYKPYCEYRYGYTVGKWVFGLKCFSVTNERISISQAFYRNIFFIAPVFFSMPIYFNVFNSDDFKNVDTYVEYLVMVKQFNNHAMLNYIPRCS